MASHLQEIGLAPAQESKSWELPVEEAYRIFMRAVYRMVERGEMPLERLSPKELGEYTVWASQQQEAELPVAA